ncbi:MAG TPA: PfkB family carbohydrate kinase [Candidatus Acidoferrales bacterium]|nr:PfkB family carbohydrate kinase [Candidatus Acidoferrales bacterium]
MTADLTRLEDLVESFPRQSIIVLGDFVADRFVFGEISRVSREAPVLILRHRETELLPGGGANAVNNIAALGAKVFPVCPVGDDDAGRALVEYFKNKKVDVSGITRVRGWSTPVKTRYLAGWTHTARQQVLRVDRLPRDPMPAAAHKSLWRHIERKISRSHAVLASDYGFNSVTPALVRSIRRKGGPKLRITLDSRYALWDYRGAGITAATPNEAELESLFHTPIGKDAAKLERFGWRTARRLGLEALLVTRGKDGMVLFEKGKKAQAIPIYGSEDAADVTGAGDTVIAVFTLALAAGATYGEAAVLANYAGGIVVMKRGTATVTREELREALQREATGKETSADTKKRR